MMGNYHVRFGGQCIQYTLTPTYDVYWCFRVYCLGPSYGAREENAEE